MKIPEDDDDLGEPLAPSQNLLRDITDNSASLIYALDDAGPADAEAAKSSS